MNDIDDLIARALRDRAGRAHVSPAGFESVRRRARLRRSRHAALAVTPVLVAAAYASGAVRGQGADVAPAAGETGWLDVSPTTECAIGPDTVPPTDGITPSSTSPTDATWTGTPTTVIIDSTVIVDSDGSVVTVAPTSTEIIPAGTTTTLPVPDTSPSPDTVTTPWPTWATGDPTTSTIAPATDGTLFYVDPATGAITVIETRCDTDGERVAKEMGCSIDDAQLAFEPGTEFAAECDEGLTAWCLVAGGDGMPRSIDCVAATVPSSVEQSSVLGENSTTSTGG
ncbi:MAG: hypothetical protein ACKO27_01310 [Ilumatobacteraceae bacterium]